jgi:serine phosphatase RsbU (regulator of sigma subunit)
MNKVDVRVSWFRSLRVQLLAGAALLLALTVAAVGYALTMNQRHSLTRTMVQTVVLQGRNVALSGEKSMLRADPEFELVPLVTRVMNEVPDMQSLVVADRSGVIQGHRDPSRIGSAYTAPSDAGATVTNALVRKDETLREAPSRYFFSTPVVSGGNTVGTVYVEYSKQALLDEQHRALWLTVRLSAAALLVGLVLSIAYFARISRPMGVLMNGLEALGRDLSFVIRMPARNEFHVLAGALTRMAQQIQQAQRDLLARERLAHEIELARQIQESLVPRGVTPVERLQIAYHYASAYEVGGDYLDIIPVGSSRMCFVMADVSGKGVPGMVVMAMTRVLVRQFANAQSSPREILVHLNDALAGNIKPGMFVTAFVGVLDLERGVLSYSNAGHNPLVCFDASGQRSAAARLKGVPIGVFPTTQFAGTLEDYTLRLNDGDIALLYTDGLVESANQREEQFTLERLVGLSDRHASGGALQLVRTLVAEEKRFRGDAPQMDDITLLAFGMTAGAPAVVEA